MAGHKGGVALEIEPGLGLEHPHGREADRHQGRLGIGRQRQLVLRPLEHQRATGSGPSAVIDLVEHGAGRGKALGQVLAHADGLAALARKHERAVMRLRRRPSCCVHRAWVRTDDRDRKAVKAACAPRG